MTPRLCTTDAKGCTHIHLGPADCFISHRARTAVESAVTETMAFESFIICAYREMGRG